MSALVTSYLEDIARNAAKRAIPAKSKRYSSKVGRIASAAAWSAMLSADSTIATSHHPTLRTVNAVGDFIRPIVAAVLAAHFDLDRQAKELIVWRAKHPDYRSEERGARVLMLVPGQGTCSVALAKMTDAEIDQLFADSIGWENGRKVKP